MGEKKAKKTEKKKMPSDLDIAKVNIDPEYLDKNREWEQLAEKELLKGYRSAKIKLQKGEEFEDIDIRIFHPSIEDEERVSEAYNRKFSELLMNEKNKTWSELLNIFDRRGIWTKQDEELYFSTDERRIKLAEEFLTAKDSGYFNNKKIDDKGIKELEKEYYKNINEILIHQNKRYQFYSQSIESIARSYAIKIQLVLCLKREINGEWVPIWSEESLNKEHGFNRQVFLELLPDAVTFWNGFPQEVLRYSLGSIKESGEESKEDSKKL